MKDFKAEIWVEITAWFDTDSEDAGHGVSLEERFASACELLSYIGAKCEE